jgi:nicotinate-nucleotide pyrophosphorylase (carboxylating)
VRKLGLDFWALSMLREGMHRKHLETLIQLALAEDIGPGDVTAEYFVAADRQARAAVVAREAGVLAGVEVARQVFAAVDAHLVVDVVRQDGSPLDAGEVIMEVRGNARSILSAERVALNFVQHLSGIATLTRRYVEAVAGTGVRILDTRKTLPGWRELEKQAVRAGGGSNHRIGLYDRAMVKDNHLLVEAGPDGLQRSITRLKAAKPTLLVELEADSLEQVERFLHLRGVDILLLDNMTLAEMREAVALRGPLGPRLEASGGVTLETVRGIAETGVDEISVGALTHSAKAWDVSMDFLPERESR